ncbi:MAG: acetylornithine deacetylase [Saprospiraceae bacterium]|nr:acetylornithine deacetylase [Saprospiraceae bacterium]
MIADKIKKTKEILKDLVAFPVLGGQSNLLIAEYITHFLTERGISVQNVYNSNRSKVSIHCRIGPSVDSGIILSGHMDVVPVEGQNWSSDPFALIEREDKWVARGSADMKGFLACCLVSADLFLESNLKKPVYFAFSYDEEIGCLAGPELVESINNFYTEKPAYAIIGEPSMMTPVIGHKGICVLQTTVYGSAGHSSRIRDEVSAVHIASKLIVWLENKMNNLVEQDRLDKRFNPPHTTIHVGTIHGGIAPNVIADRCVFQWDVRVIPMDDIESILTDFREYCDEVLKTNRNRFADMKIETIMFHPPVPPLDTDGNEEVVNLIKRISGQNITKTVAYAAEAGQFSQGGFQTVICGPGDIAQAHRADEFIAANQIKECLLMLEKLAVELSE